ncbi:MAG TPA: arabinofuranosidase catalytic domain-containing protein, partial [Ktedonobacteraceae bacterium]|nr:arabinofuranosidase catalytic domain-containing protein [Ktedonobacteraceae bacterium]
MPCDIYASGGTPCVAAHSTVRALYSAYNGNLYQVRRASNNATLNIGVLSAGGYANAAAQDSFCAGTTCVITIIYDQSGRGNNLTQAPGGGAAGGPDTLANASALPLTVNGHHVYGVYIASGMGYRDDNTNGIATGDNPAGEYAIFDGTHYNGGCCFDYGNAETNNNDDGNGTMEAIYFGNIKVWGYGSGNGPWVMADLENGLFSGANVHLNSGDQSITSHYVTAMVKGGPNLWAIHAGNAQSGSLSTMYSGPRPNVSGYNPMKKQGAIILGIGGDNSKGAAGSFFEGAMTSGYPSDATESAVQASIVAAGYGNGGSSTAGVLRGTSSNRCLDVPGAATANGTLLDIWDCNGGSNQQWTSLSNGELQVYGNKCLDVPGNATTAGTRVDIYDC